MFLDHPDHYSLTRTVPAGWPEPALKEIVMNRFRYIRRIAAVLGGLAAALAALGATPAFARPDPDGTYAPTAPTQIPAPVHIRTVVAGGMPGWQITLIAVGAALAAAAIAVLLDRALTSRRHVIQKAA